jgi:hypothetical protein
MSFKYKGNPQNFNPNFQRQVQPQAQAPGFNFANQSQQGGGFAPRFGAQQVPFQAQLQPFGAQPVQFQSQPQGFNKPTKGKKNHGQGQAQFGQPIQYQQQQQQQQSMAPPDRPIEMDDILPYLNDQTINAITAGMEAMNPTQKEVITYVMLKNMHVYTHNSLQICTSDLVASHFIRAFNEAAIQLRYICTDNAGKNQLAYATPSFVLDN